MSSIRGLAFVGLMGTVGFSYGAVLLGNWMTSSAYTAVGANCNQLTYRAVRFTTPAYATTLTTVRVRTAVSISTDAPSIEFRTGQTNSSPGVVQHVIAPPLPYPIGVQARTYTSTGFTFQPSTTYSIVVRNPSSTASASWYRADQNTVPSGLAAYINTMITYNNGTFATDSLRPLVEINIADPTRTISGNLTLADTQSPFAANRTMTYQITQGTATVQTGTVISGTSTVPFSFTVPQTATGAAVLTFDGSSFLKRSANINLTGTTVAVGTVVMANGDVDASGEVDAADIDLVISAFGDTSSAATDVDVSGEVDAADIDIVIANFGGTDD